MKIRGRALVIIGITDEDKETVGGFMEKMEMNYTIAIDQDSETWSFAVSTGVDGIPHAFVVKQGRLFWEGSPMDGFDSAVSAILDNNYDLEKAIADQRIKRLAEVWVPQYTLLAADKANAEAADALGNRILEQCGNHAQVLNELAWNIVSDKTLAYRNLDFALQLAEKACALTDTPSSDMLDTHARALYEKGRTEEAIARQKQAIEVCDDESEKTDQLMPFLEEMENPDAHAQRMRLTQDADLYMTFARYGLDVAEADAIGERLLNSAISDAGMLSGIAWYIAIGDDLAYRNLDFACNWRKAVALTERNDPDILDTYAEVLEMGRKEEAIAQLRRVLDVAEDDDMRNMLKEKSGGNGKRHGGSAELTSLLCDEYKIYAPRQSGRKPMRGTALLAQNGGIASPSRTWPTISRPMNRWHTEILILPGNWRKKPAPYQSTKTPYADYVCAVLLAMDRHEEAIAILKQAAEVAEDDDTRTMIEDMLSTLEEGNKEDTKEEDSPVPENAA